MSAPALTLAALTIAILAFVLLRTVIWSWTVAVEQAAVDRIGSRHKVSFIMEIPKRYAEDIRQIPGIKHVAYATWFGAKYPKDKDAFFGSIAVEPEDEASVHSHAVGLNPCDGFLVTVLLACFPVGVCLHAINAVWARAFEAD